MSRSNPTEGNRNPATRFYEWSGASDGGYFTYFDKSLGEKGEKVSVKLPFQFLVLDELVTISGFSDKDQCGIYANEIRDTRYGELVVRSFKGGEIARGLYADIKDRVTSKAVGGKFAKSLYIAYKDVDGLKIGHIIFTGAAVSAWMDFTKANKVYNGAVVVTEFTDHKKGTIEYRCPVFAMKECSEETNHAATELDRELQTYLRDYLKADHSAAPDREESAPEHVTSGGSDVGPTDDDIPFAPYQRHWY